MKKYSLTLLFFASFLKVFADHIPGPESTEPSMLTNILVIGVFAVVMLLIVRRVRKRRIK
ncbi:hypothetical protein [Spirosoma panaciterrae]|uniref:hypothetical protein n=1 Tax=Spirosoma panaciterrae TaxID=496058 RepID=UPI0003720AA2|nr:hypothetical protein [Spirosoma panaciterrae]